MQQLPSSSGGTAARLVFFKAAICAQNAPKYQVYICFLCLCTGFKCQMADGDARENGEASRGEKCADPVGTGGGCFVCFCGA